MRIDAHQHFWRLADRVGAWPPPELAAIHRDFAPQDLLPLLQAAGVGGTVLVQSLPTAADTAFLLDLADRHAFVRGVVGWADLKAPDAAAQIGALARHPRLVGLRPMLQDLPDDWLDDPALDRAVAAMQMHGLCFDALVRPPQLPALWRFARRHLDLPIVIDHAAKPAIVEARLQPWGDDMARLAMLPQVHCKLSGLLTEAGSGPPLGNDSPSADEYIGRSPAGIRAGLGAARRSAWSALQPYVHEVLRCFGVRRVLWGSDWPVLNLAGDDGAWLALCQVLLDRFDPPVDTTARAALFGGNAQRFYRLPQL